MTTGSIDVTVVNEYTEDGYPLLKRSQSSWNGSDGPSSYVPTPKQYVETFLPPIYSRKGRLKYPGKRVMKRVLPPKKVIKKYRPPNNYTKTGSRVSQSWYRIHASKGVDTTHFFGFLDGYQLGGNLPSWDIDDELKLVSKLQESLKGSTFHLGVSSAEAGQTFRFIAESAKKLSRFVALAKKGRFPAALQAITDGRRVSGRPRKMAIRDVSDAFLSYEYAVRPLLSDVEEAAQYLGYLTSAPKIGRFTATRLAQGSYSSELLVAGHSPYCNLTMTVESRLSKKLIAFVKSRDETKIIGLGDVSSIAYELAPFSFVLDWFVPIGSYLDSLNFLTAIEADYVRCTKTNLNFLTSSLRINNLNGWTCSFLRKPDSFRRETFSFSREVLNGGYPLAMPSIRQNQKTYTARHAADAVALLLSHR